MIQFWHATLLATQAQEGAAEAAEATAPPELKPYYVAGAVLVLLIALVKRKSCSAGMIAGTACLCGLVLLYGMGSPLQTWVDAGAASVWTQFGDWLSRPMLWALLFGSLSLMLMLPLGARRQYVQGAVAGIVSLGFLMGSLPMFADAAGQAVFWMLALVTLVSAAATVTMRSPVYSAIWFALSLLGTAGLFFYQGSQFLGVATIVVYAGAIVVTFLFVVMLAQPEGQATYDRLSWGRLPKLLSVIAGAMLVACLAYAVSGAAANRQAVADAAEQLQDASLPASSIVRVLQADSQLTVTVRTSDASPEALDQSAARLSDLLQKPVTLELLADQDDVLHDSHMARLGAVMFTQQLLSVELAGTLLLVALVGAIAMAIQGKDDERADAAASQPVTEESS